MAYGIWAAWLSMDASDNGREVNALWLRREKCQKNQLQWMFYLPNICTPLPLPTSFMGLLINVDKQHSKSQMEELLNYQCCEGNMKEVVKIRQTWTAALLCSFCLADTCDPGLEWCLVLEQGLTKHDTGISNKVFRSPDRINERITQCCWTAFNVKLVHVP